MPRSLLTDSNRENRFTSAFKVANCFVILLAKKKLVATGKYIQIQLLEAVA